MSLVSRSCAARVVFDSVLSADSSSDRSFAKSTFCVYVALAASSRSTIVRVRFWMLEQECVWLARDKRLTETR